MVMNQNPLWKYILIVVVIVIGFLFAAPNLFGDDPAIEISPANTGVTVNDATATQITQILQTASITSTRIQPEGHSLLVRLKSTDDQLKAKDLIQESLGENYLVALNLAPRTPDWLRAIGALPMKLGLDLRGGVHFLMQVDIDSVVKARMEGYAQNITQDLRRENIRYAGIAPVSNGVITVQFRNADEMDQAYSFLNQRYGNDLAWSKPLANNQFQLQGRFTPVAMTQTRQETIEQAMNTLRNRVNELGVSEAVVQQQGATRIQIDLPGIQDTTLAKNIIGKTATLEFHLVDTQHDPRDAIGGVAPAGTHLYYSQQRPVLLQNAVILRGSAIKNANSGVGPDGRPAVDIRLGGGGGERLFSQTTAENIGKPLAVLYIEVRSDVKTINGQPEITYQTEKKVISVATIQSALGGSFQITGLGGQDEARTLALLLRAGALPTPVSFIEERQIGPSLGKQNIHMGIMSVEVGFFLVVIFMALYYRGMGLIADLALGLNLILIMALLSILGATLTLPGIAAMVLTVGMAVDANVLIFERIREELRNNMGVQASIHIGYEKAFMTILDANVTTLIVAVILFSLGSGAIKGFAVTLTIGLITSMFTAITGTRVLVNLIYGGRPVKSISIGI